MELIDSKDYINHHTIQYLLTKWYVTTDYMPSYCQEELLNSSSDQNKSPD